MIPSIMKTVTGRRAFIVCCSFLLTYSNNAQVNLVVNPSFEEITSCPTYHSQLSLATGWDTLRNGGGGPWTYLTLVVRHNYAVFRLIGSGVVQVQV